MMLALRWSVPCGSAEKKDQSGVYGCEEHAAPCVVLGCANEKWVSGSCRDSALRSARIKQTGDGGNDDAQGYHKLEDCGAPAPVVCGQAPGKVKGDNNRDDAATHALQQRPTGNTAKLCERTMSPMLARNISALPIMMDLRPSQSASRPAITDENMLPPSTAATMIDVCPRVRLTVLLR